MLVHGQSVTFDHRTYQEAVRLGVTRFLEDRVRGIHDAAADHGVKDGTGRNPWCTIDIQGVISEMAFASLAGVPYDRTTHARCETGQFDTRLPSGLYVDVKWAEAPGAYGNMLVRSIKAPYLRDRQDVICAQIYGRIPLNMDYLRERARRTHGASLQVWQFLRTNVETVVKHVIPADIGPTTFTFGGWMWGNYVAHPDSWAASMPEPCYRVEQHLLIQELPLDVVPTRRPYRETMYGSVAAPIDLTDLDLHL